MCFSSLWIQYLGFLDWWMKQLISKCYHRDCGTFLTVFWQRINYPKRNWQNKTEKLLKITQRDIKTTQKLISIKTWRYSHMLDISYMKLQTSLCRWGENELWAEQRRQKMSSSLVKLQKILKPLMTANCWNTHTCHRHWQRLAPKYSVRGWRLKVKLATDTSC